MLLLGRPFWPLSGASGAKMIATMFVSAPSVSGSAQRFGDTLFSGSAAGLSLNDGERTYHRCSPFPSPMSDNSRVFQGNLPMYEEVQFPATPSTTPSLSMSGHGRLPDRLSSDIARPISASFACASAAAVVS